jgi:hypothetical protein
MSDHIVVLFDTFLRLDTLISQFIVRFNRNKSYTMNSKQKIEFKTWCDFVREQTQSLVPAKQADFETHQAQLARFMDSNVTSYVYPRQLTN